MTYAFLDEAKHMADYCNDHPGLTTAGADFYTLCPEARWVLEGLLESKNGLLFIDVWDYSGGDSFPKHIRDERRFYMKHVRDFEATQGLFEAMLRLYPTPGYTTGLALREARKWLLDMLTDEDTDPVVLCERLTAGFSGLADELPELEPNDGITELPPELLGEEVDPDEVYYSCSSFMRQELVHKPGGDLDDDWAMNQGEDFRRIFWGVRSAKTQSSVDKWRDEIVAGKEKQLFNYVQQDVLWGVYFARRDWLRLRDRTLVEKNMGKACKAILSDLPSFTDPAELSQVGIGMHKWMEGFLANGVPCPGPVSKIEWSYIWNVYHQQKDELAEQPVQSSS